MQIPQEKLEAKKRATIRKKYTKFKKNEFEAEKAAENEKLPCPNISNCAAPTWPNQLPS